MVRRLILLTDFTQSYASDLLKGILDYAKEGEPWVVCRMPPYYKQVHGVVGVVDWAKRWKADAIIGQFEGTDNVRLFAKYGIVAMAHDYKRRFKSIANITCRHEEIGRMAAEFFMQKGFRHFAYYGYENVFWSARRCRGFVECLEGGRLAGPVAVCQSQPIDSLWSYDTEALSNWIRSLTFPVAVFACDDNCANRVAEVCRMLGVRIPDQVAVLGVNNDETICNLSYPALSSISLGIAKGGYKAAALIDQMIGHEEIAPQNVMIDFINIVERASTDIYATDHPSILKALHFIHNHLSKSLSVQDVVEQVPMSRRLLEMKFKEETGYSVHQYILNLRMDRFSQLLLSSDAPISEIAMSVGIPEPKNLARQFKSHKGMTPAEYRRRYKM